MYRPLADRIRPNGLDDVVGQEHILGKNGMLRRIIESGNIPNMVFYGPSGTGKTTIANIIANKTNRKLYKLNATTASISDIKEIIAQLDTLLAPEGVLLYLDEIQYFNKKQQQSLLEFMENGKITLIASTTENPYFYVYNALLSRSTVFEFKHISSKEIERAVRRGFSIVDESISVSDEVISFIAKASGGDVRRSLVSLELLSDNAKVIDGVKTVTMEDAEAIAQKGATFYDRDGDAHYDIMSALQKSIRGSDADAAVHYLARLLEAGDLISACRRILVCACEDIGLAYPQAVSIVKSCIDAARELGLPEARIPLSQAVILLATAPKSNSAICAIDDAMSDIRTGKCGDVPVHLKDAHYSGAEKLGRGLTYKYPHSFENHWVDQQYLPDEIKDKRYYVAGDNKFEQATDKYWQEIKKTGK